MFDRIQFLLGEGFLALRRNGWMTFAAVTTVAVALFLIGGLAYAYNLAKVEAGTMTGLLEIRASMVDGTNQAQISAIAKEIRQIDGVKSAAWIPRDKAWAKYLSENPKHKEFAEIGNPYPDMFKVNLTDLKQSDAVVAKIKSIEGIKTDEVKYESDVARFILGLQGIVRWLGFVIGGMLFITAGVLIYNAIRLTVISRRLEIRIMQLVGASFLTVRIPFYIEGFIQGALGGLISVVVLYAAQVILNTRLPQISATLQLPPFPWILFLTTLPLLGATYGLICSMIAVRTPLRYR